MAGRPRAARSMVVKYNRLFMPSRLMHAAQASATCRQISDRSRRLVMRRTATWVSIGRHCRARLVRQCSVTSCGCISVHVAVSLEVGHFRRKSRGVAFADEGDMAASPLVIAGRSVACRSAAVSRRFGLAKADRRSVCVSPDRRRHCSAFGITSTRFLAHYSNDAERSHYQTTRINKCRVIGSVPLKVKHQRNEYPP